MNLYFRLMNYLAHIFLSGDNPQVAIGNFIADAMKGNSYKTYSQDIQIGILLHRFIDTYTDAHPVFRQSTKKLHKGYGHYSGVIVDIFYDHFLAKNWNTFHNKDLNHYSLEFYKHLKANLSELPERIQDIAPLMITHNWLVNYASIDGIQKVLNGMSKRTSYESNMNRATKELQLFYDDFEADFLSFFEDIRRTSKEKLHQLTQDFKL